MIKRFHIEDLISQDPWGVIFRAIDKETGNPVSVRRFFPFGADGGGLEAEEQRAYDEALTQLAKVTHPALRAVICGGCDPVDAMPYIATEWIDGDPVQTFLRNGPLPAEAATELLSQALEVCELLSQVIGEESVWIETSTETIIVGSDQSGRGFTFWMSPLKWLCGHDRGAGLSALVTLTEELMGWQNRALNDYAGRGLAGWLKWLRQHARNTTLHEARETLAAAVGVDPPPAFAKPLATVGPPRPVVMPKKRRSLARRILLGGVAVGATAAAVGGWLVVKRGGDLGLAFLTKAVVPLERQANMPGIPSPTEATDGAGDPLVRQQAAADRNHGVIAWDSRELLLERDGEEVVVGGVLAGVIYSDKRDRLYLTFSKPSVWVDPRGTVTSETAEATAELSAEALSSLVGKKIRLRGPVTVNAQNGRKRAEIMINDRAAIEVAE